MKVVVLCPYCKKPQPLEIRMIGKKQAFKCGVCKNFIPKELIKKIFADKGVEK